MNKDIWVFNFSGIYDNESFYLSDKGSFNVVDMSKISGTNCMCDDDAVQQIRQIFKEQNVSPYGIHFIDNGNYHYMSALTAQMQEEPFSLVVLDHHPDMQPPMFGDILSCGGWVKEVFDKNPNVRDIHIIGADRGLISELDEEDRKRVAFYDPEDIFGERINLPDTEYPVFLSIDKDVVSDEELTTNWDQGELKTEELILFVKELFSQKKVVAMDICGECAPDMEGCDVAKACAENDSLNKALLDCAI